MINNAYFLISKEAFFKLVHTVPSRKLCKSTNMGGYQAYIRCKENPNIPNSRSTLFLTTVIVFAPAVAFTASVLATYTAFVLGANTTRKSAKCDSFHYCAASHSSVNCLIDCCLPVRSALVAFATTSKRLPLSCHFSRVRLYSPKSANAVAPRV